MFDVLTGFVAFLLALTMVVFIHELGHFWAARLSGIKVEVFSVGFGKELFGFTDRQGCRWRFSLVPLGGYVRMAGERGSGSDSPEFGGAARSGSLAKGDFLAASLPRRAFVVAMGPLANFALGIGIFMLIFMLVGKIVVPPVVDEISADSAAESAGFEIGDRIVNINGYGIDDFSHMRSLIAENPGRPVEMVIVRDGLQRHLTVTPESIFDACTGVEYGRLGVISRSGHLVKLGAGSALVTAVSESYTMSLAMLRGLGRLITGQSNKGELGGPVKIAEISGMTARQGMVDFFFWVGLLSVNLGLINLMPVPALDGGHLLFFGLEGIMRRPLSRRLQDMVMRLGISLLIALILYVTFFDVLSLMTSQC